jgi:prepilin signal peptidase PulO-like enzyme (type II secretory pathway)
MLLLATWHCLLINPHELGLLGLVQLGVLGCGLILLIATDLESYIIPEESSLVPLVVSLALAYFVPSSHLLADPWVAPSSLANVPQAAAWNALIDAVQGAILSAAACYGLGALGELYKRVAAMGGGDVLLMSAIGATVGWKLGVLTIILGAFVGIAMWIGQQAWLALRGKKSEAPRFDLPDANTPQPPWYARALDLFSVQWTGAVLLVVNGGLLYYALQIVKDQMANTAILFGPSIGVGLGAFFILFHLVRKHHTAKGTWIQTQVETGADGKQVEVYDENQAYLPFGPALAIAGFFMAIWGPWFVRQIEMHLMGLPPEMLTHFLRAPFVK